MEALINDTIFSSNNDLFIYFSNIVICAGMLACLDGYMNIAMEQTEVNIVEKSLLWLAWA